MNVPLAYYWNHGEIITTSGATYTHLIEQDHPECMYLYCYDAAGTEDERFGMYFPEDKEGWSSIPFESFPPEFRAQLLLMGVL